MNKQITDEKTNIRYTLQGAYSIFLILHYPPRKNSPLEYGSTGVQWTPLPKAEAPTEPAGETGL